LMLLNQQFGCLVYLVLLYTVFGSPAIYLITAAHCILSFWYVYIILYKYVPFESI
jgi:hypothetical protein